MGTAVAFAGQALSIMPGWQWVVAWIAGRFPPENLTRKNYLSDWHVWQQFLTAHSIADASALTRDNMLEFVQWREGQGIKRSTIIKQVIFMSTVLGEAQLRGLVERNVASKMGLRRSQRTEHCEITPAMEEEIRAAIARERKLKEFYRMSFEIAIHQGCRLAETRLNIPRQVNFAQNQITFWIKGGRWHTTLLHPKVKELLQSLDREWTYEHPKANNDMSSAWGDFWHRHEFRERYPLLVFHSCRITVVSRLARAGVTESKCMAYVGHSGVEVHRIYQRLRVSDLQECLDAL